MRHEKRTGWVKGCCDAMSEGGDDEMSAMVKCHVTGHPVWRILVRQMSSEKSHPHDPERNHATHHFPKLVPDPIPVFYLFVRPILTQISAYKFHRALHRALTLTPSVARRIIKERA